MSNIFYELLNMSLKASYVILAVILVRLLLKKAPKKYSYALWLCAAFRLVCPVSFKSVISLFALRAAQNTTTYVDLTQVVSPSVNTILPQANVGIPAVNAAINNSLPAQTPQYSANPTQIIMHIAMIVWLLGIAALLVYGVVSYVILCRKLRFAVKFEDNIWQSDAVSSPFIMGFVKPKIYIPFGLDNDKLNYVLEHEKTHIRRFDHIIKPLAFVVLAVHWFNPLVWLSFYLMSRDMEMSCDEKVLSKNESANADYSSTLLSLAVKKKFPAPSPLAFGESDVKKRIKNALKFKKPALWITVVAVIICIAVIFICAADPKEKETTTADDIFGHVYSVPEIICKDGNVSYDIDIYWTGYYIDEDGIIYYKGWTEEEPWHEFGKLERCELTKENFDNYFVNDEIWKDGYSAQKLREENKNAWKLEQQDDYPFYILQQKNGELFSVSIAPDSNKDANAYDSFILRLDSNDDIFKQAYSVPEVIYIDGKYSLMPVTDETPYLYIDEVGRVYSKEWNFDAAWSNVGSLKKITLTKENFDVYFENGGDIWEDGYSIKKIRNENLNAWKFEANGNIYYVLQQKNGECLYAALINPRGTDKEGEYCVRWIYRLVPTSDAEVPSYSISGDSYVSYQCLYMTPVSSFAAVGGDSGYRYVFVMDEELAYCKGLVRVDRTTGDIMAMDYGDWGVFPYTEEDWNGMFMGTPVDISGYTAREWMPLSNNYALALMDSSELWFVEIRNDEIWSIYSLVPEEYMGKAVWNYTEGETLKIDFDIPGNMTAVCTQRDISSDGVTFDVGADWSDGSLYWNPVNENGELVNNAQIHFSSDSGYAGVVYIVGSPTYIAGSATRYGMQYTVETSGTGLYIENTGDTVRVSVKNEIFVSTEEPTASRDPIDFTVDNTSEDFFRYEDIEGRTMTSYKDYTNTSGIEYSFRSPEAASECAEIVVVGEIVDKHYVDGNTVNDVEGACIVYDLKISQGLRGEYVTGDIISVVCYGGYYRWYLQSPQRYEAATAGNPKYAGMGEVGIVIGYGGVPEMQIGEEYIMFLHGNRRASFVDGARMIVGYSTGAYKINDDGTVSRYIKPDRIWSYGTLDEVIQEVKDAPFDEEKYYDLYIGRSFSD